MNKKGFTTVELILTMAVVMVIMATITGVTYTYRDRSSMEEYITDALNYKNSVTKIIYDDILDVRSNSADSKGKVTKISKVSDTSYQFITESGTIYNLSIINTTNKVGIKYGLSGDEIEYIVPGSESNLVTFNECTINTTEEDADYYRLDITFKHINIENPIEIHFIVSK